MILLFDLDRTILDTNKFNKGLSKIFGISLKKHSLHVDSFFRKKSISYSPEAHIKLLKKLGHLRTASEIKKIEDSYEIFLKTINNCLFPESEKMLTHLKNKGHQMFLITLGSSPSQKKKVINAGLEKYFEKIIYETKSKSQNKFIKQLAKLDEEILIINDKAEESLAIKKTLGKKAKIFLIDGPWARTINHKEEIHKNLKKLKHI